MSTTIDYYKYSVLATASYVRMGRGPYTSARLAELAPTQAGGRLPSSQATTLFNPADANAPRWSVLSYYGADIPADVDPIAAADKSGFGATLFEREGGKVLALRGTEASEDFAADVMSADLGQIGFFGLALTQVVSMANYVMRLKVPQDELVTQIKVEATLTRPASGPYLEAQGIGGSTIYLALSTTTPAYGLNMIQPGELVKLTGHSLGGHLAVMAAKLFPDVFASDVVVFNSPGYDPSATSWLGFLGKISLGVETAAALFKGAMALEFGTPALLGLATEANQLTQGDQPTRNALQAINELLRPSDGIAIGNPNVIAVTSEDLAPGDDVSLIAGALTGADKYGAPVNLPTEENNHVIEPLMDALALQAAIEPMQGQSFGLNELTRVLQASSRENARSYEELAERLLRVFVKNATFLDEKGNVGAAHLPTSVETSWYTSLFGTGKGSIGARNASHDAVLRTQKEIEAHPGVQILSLVDLSAEALKNVAKDGDLDAPAYRYALVALNPFAVVGAPSLYYQDGALALYDEVAHSGTLTTEYLVDRAAFLHTKNEANILDLDRTVSDSQVDNVRYVDLPQNFTVTAYNLTPTENPRLAIFGGEKADKLEGGSQSDRLYAGGGTDWLIGRGANDYQEGGAGLDLYQYNAKQPFLGDSMNDGADTIRDTDGLGVLRYTFMQGGILFDTTRSSVIVDTSIRVNDATWQSADGKFDYEKLGTDLVVTINGDAGGSLTLRDFRDGDFGIHLWSGRADSTIGRTLEGDRKPEDADPDLAGDQLAYDNWGNVITTSDVAQDRDDALFGRDDELGDAIIAGGGNDILLGDTPMMALAGPRIGFDPLQSGGADWLQGDSGRDFIDAGPGNDLVEGGFGGAAGTDAGGDVMQGGLGDDTLYGEFRIEIGAAIRYGETDAPSTLKGDFISGGAGDDWLIGSNAKDVLMGGGGKDVLIGGAGDDVIRGDDGQGATTLAWTVTLTPPVPNEPNVYTVDFTGTNFFDFSEGGADAIYGGAGKDWVFAEAGDDFVDGGSGDDVLFGGFGSDIILGGAGDDVIAGDEGVANAAEGGDYLDGGDGNDTIFGNGGDDIIVGGRGDDILVGGAGKDVYVYDKGDGRDTIDDSDTAGSAASVIQFGPGLDREDIKFSVGSLKIDFGNGDEVHVEGFDQVNPSNTPLISELRFDDGQVMTFADILAQGFDIDGTSAGDLITGTGVVDRIRGLEGNDVLIGPDGDDFLYGGSGSDTLRGGAGNDYLEGGEGFDTLEGGAGDDSYVYDTFDTVTDSEGVNRIVFGEGIAPESLSVSSFVVSGQPRLLVERPGTTGAGLELRGASISSPNFAYAFADGRTLSQTEFLQAAYFVPQSITGTAGNDTLTGFAGNDSVYGGGGNDTISGGAGNDSLNGGDNDDLLLGGAGNDYLSGFNGSDTLSGGSGADWLDGGEGADTYVFGYGDGNDTISESGLDAGVDTVRLADGISLSDLTLTHEPNADLTVTLNATQERLKLSGWYTPGMPRVEQVVFADGTVVGEAELAAISIAPILGTAGNDVLQGTPYVDTLEGLAGDDVLDAGPNTFLLGDGQSNDLLIGGEGHDTYILGWRGARDTVIEQAGETSTIRFAPAMTFDDVVGTREGDDLFVHGRRTEHGLLLKNYYTQAHDWYIETAAGSSMSLLDFLARPAPTIGDPVRDLWEARKTQFKHDWYPFTPGVLQSDGTVYRAPDFVMRADFGRTYDNGDWANGAGSLLPAPFYASEETSLFGTETVISSDAASQYWGVWNDNDTTTRSNATYDVAWNAPAITRTTTYYGTYVGFDLLFHSLYRTFASVSLSGTAQGMTLNAADGASGPDVVAATMSGSPLPSVVNGFFDSTTGSFNPVEIRGGPSRNVIAHRSFGMVDGGAGNDVIDSVGGGMRWDTGESGNFLYGGAGDDGITGSGDGDLICGGPGNDQLAGWSGDDTFYFFAGDTGVDVVNEATWYLWDTYDGVVSGRSLYNADSGRDSEDTVEFGPGISLAGLALSWGTYDSRYAWWSPAPLKTYDTLDIYWGTGKGVRVMMPDRFDPDVRFDIAYSPGSSWGVEHFKFADGTNLSLQQMADRIPTRVLNGTAGDDYLEGSAGNNEFFARAGFDDLYGSFGSDTYHFNLGDGEDWITDPGGNDKVVFGAGITADMLSLGIGSLLIRVGSGGDALHIEYFDANDPLKTGAIETYQFADGTTLTYADLIARGFDLFGSDFADTLTGTGVTDRMYGLGGDDMLAGGAGSDVLDGGAGNDFLMGGEGSDTYRFDLGGGFDTVEETDAQGDDTDSVVLGPGITSEDMNVARAGNDIVLTVNGASDRLALRNWFAAPGYRVERVEFADGVVWDAAMLEWLAFLSDRPPQLTAPIADQTAHEDAQFVFAVPADAFADPDVGDALAYTASQADGTALPGWLVFNSLTRTFSGTPAQSDIGAVDVRIMVTDLWGLSAQDTFELTVLNTNDAPVLANALPDQAATAGAPFSFTIAAGTFADYDPGDTLTLSAVRSDATMPSPPPLIGGSLLPPPPPPPSDGGSLLPTWLRFDAPTQTFSGTPTNDDVGTLEIRVTATDGSGASVSDVFAITISPGNRGPVVSNPIPDQQAIEDSTFSFAIPPTAITDPDTGDVLAWSATAADGGPLPGWLIFDAVNRAFSGTPRNEDVGSFSVLVTATDGSNASASDVFDITVANTNDAPTVEQPIADQSATEDQAFELTVPSGTFADVDVGDTLTLSASLADGSLLPAWLSFSGSVLSGTPLNADVGGYDVQLNATDAAGASATDVFHLDVANVNDAPVVASPLEDQSFEANAAFTFTVPIGSFVDEDVGDTLAYSASLFGGGALPSWLTFDAATATFKGTPATDDIGISHVAVTATDTSGASAVSDFGLIVRAPADAKVTGGDGDDIIYGGTGDETLVGKAGDDALFGDVGDDVLRGGTGIDVLQGGDGLDVLHGGIDNNVLDGGSGDDLIFDGSGDSFISGGAGNDTIKMSTGNDVIAFNSGDGWDTIIGGGDGGNTLSFGGGIRYRDLSLSKAGDDLIVNAGTSDGIVVKNWYAGSQSVLNLQIILDATDEFDAGSSDPLYNRRVQTFNFLGLVSAFDQARTASPGLTSWDVTNALLQWHLWGADDAALGGDLAYWYGKNRALTGISLAAAQQVIGATGFGSDAQSLRPFSGLQEGFVKLS